MKSLFNPKMLPEGSIDAKALSPELREAIKSNTNPVPVIDSLDSFDSKSALSANKGRVLEVSKADKESVYFKGDTHILLADKADKKDVFSKDEISLLLQDKISIEPGKQLTDENFTKGEKRKLSLIEDPYFMGSYPNESEAHKFAKGYAGAYCWVDTGFGNEVVKFVWSVEQDGWTTEEGAPTSETPASIKEKYESIPDTNPFTDSEKVKLSTVKDGAEPNQPLKTLDGASLTGTEDIRTEFAPISYIPSAYEITEPYLDRHLKGIDKSLHGKANVPEELSTSIIYFDSNYLGEVQDGRLETPYSNMKDALNYVMSEGYCVDIVLLGNSEVIDIEIRCSVNFIGSHVQGGSMSKLSDIKIRTSLPISFYGVSVKGIFMELGTFDTGMPVISFEKCQLIGDNILTKGIISLSGCYGNTEGFSNSTISLIAGSSDEVSSLSLTNTQYIGVRSQNVPVTASYCRFRKTSMLVHNTGIQILYARGTTRLSFCDFTELNDTTPFVFIPVYEAKVNVAHIVNCGLNTELLKSQFDYKEDNFVWFGVSEVREAVLPTFAISDDLTSDNPEAALSSRMGKILDEKKVNKVIGKGLSTKDYTKSDKEKLDGIQPGAQVNDTIEQGDGIKVTKTGSIVTISADLDIVNNLESFAEDKPLSSKMGKLLQDNKANKGEVYLKKKVDEILEGYQLKEDGKGLSSNDFTTVEKDKLNKIDINHKWHEVHLPSGEGITVTLGQLNLRYEGSGLVQASAASDPLDIQIKQYGKKPLTFPISNEPSAIADIYTYTEFTLVTDFGIWEVKPVILSNIEKSKVFTVKLF